MIPLKAAQTQSDQFMYTALSLAAITGHPFRLDGFRLTGLQRCHLSTVHAFAAICLARVAGAELGSRSLTFIPESPPVAGSYDADVESASSLLPAISLPLALAAGESRVILRGTTHGPSSSSFDELHDAWRPMLRRIGFRLDMILDRWGWESGCPGELRAHIEGLGRCRTQRRCPLRIRRRGRLLRIAGRAAAANLPVYVSQEIADHARTRLRDLAVDTGIGQTSVCAGCAGIDMFLLAEYEHICCGFSGYGGRGKSLNAVADEAVNALKSHHESQGTLDVRLADQLLRPLSLVGEKSTFTVDERSPHLEATAWLIERFGLARIIIEPWSDQKVVLVTIDPGIAACGDPAPFSGRDGSTIAERESDEAT